MSSFDKRLKNDPDFLKGRKDLANKLYQEKSNLIEQLKNAKMGRPHLSLTLDRKVQNTRELENALKKDSRERQQLIKEQYEKHKMDRAKELGKDDKAGYEKWLKEENDRKRQLVVRNQMRSQTKEITKEQERFK